jgi:chromosome segregation ATPase
MRDGPPESASTEGGDTSSASTLLKEITSLRGRLMELEDDTRSSVCDDSNDLTNMLRKELSKVEHDKANLEKEFMNQLSLMANENHNIIASLEAKLVESQQENEQLKAECAGGSAEDGKVARMRIAEEREAHTREIEQMKVNLASADMEIADGRREMDHMHEEIVELQSQKEALVEEMSVVRQDLGQEKKLTESLRVQLNESENEGNSMHKELIEKDAYIDAKHEELGEMNDSLIVLEEHKEMLVAEVTDVRAQLMKEEEANVGLQAKIEELQTPKHFNLTPPRPKGPLTVEIEAPITPAEKEQLEDGVTALEERLQRLQSKLSEKDKTIDNLAAALSEERKINKKLKREINGLKGKPPDCTSPIESRIASQKKKANNVKDSLSEMDFLRKQNKILNDEVKTLKMNDGVAPMSSSRSNSPNPEMRNTRSKSPQPRTMRPEPMTPPMVSRKAGVHAIKCPRTPVSGIVASFEQRISKVRPRNGEDEESVASLPMALEIVDMRQELYHERETVADLKDMLREEKELVVQLRANLVKASNETNFSSGNLELQLLQSEEEIGRLRTMVKQYEDRQSEMEVEIQKAEIDTRLQDKEIQRLQEELSQASQEEKKSDSFDSDGDQELVRLRAQAAALQPELDRALTDIESLQCDVDRLRKALKSEQISSLRALQKVGADDESVSGKDQKGFEREINHLKVELTKTQMSKAELEMEYMTGIKELEAEIEALEVETEEELDEKQKQLDSLKSSLAFKEGEVARLEKEKAQICSSMKNASFSRKDDMEDLQAELMETTVKTTTQAREIQSLKMKIGEYEARKDEDEKKVQDRLEELEGEIDSTRQSSRNQVSREEFVSLRSENNKLRESIRNVTLERRRLQERLDSLVSDKSSSKSVQVLRDRNTTLKKEVEKLTKRLIKMEASITRCAV